MKEEKMKNNALSVEKLEAVSGGRIIRDYYYRPEQQKAESNPVIETGRPTATLNQPEIVEIGRPVPTLKE